MRTNLIINFFLALIIFSQLSCLNSIETSQLELRSTLTEKHTFLSDGIWLIKPYDFYEATTYKGFQANNYEASISLNIVNDNFNNLNKKVDVESLEKNNYDVLENRKLRIQLEDGTFRNGRLLSLINKQKRTQNVEILIEDGSKTIRIKSFYFIDLKTKYEKAINNSLRNIYIGKPEISVTEKRANTTEVAEENEPKQELTLAKENKSKNEFIYTKDGSYPTKLEDGYTLKVMNLEKNYDNPERVLEKEFKKAFGFKPDGSRQDNYSNMKVFSSNCDQVDKKGFVQIMQNADKAIETIIVCYGNDKFNIQEEMYKLKLKMATVSLKNSN